MVYSPTMLAIFQLFVLLTVCYGSDPTNTRSDRITQAISASEDAIGRAVSGKTNARMATEQSRAFAKLAARDGAKPSDFGRRRLLSGVTNTRSDRISQALSASTDAIGSAVSGKTDVRVAVTKSKAFARMATRDGAQPSDFGRKLQSGGTNTRSDRISQALSASTDAIGSAVSGKTDVRVAVTKSKTFAHMATRDGAQPSDFGRKMLSGATNNRSDRITQSLSSSEDAIGAAVAGNTNARFAAAQSKAYSMLATRDGAHPSDFGK